MGRRIVKVPEDFAHPTDETGELVPGAHLEPLYNLAEEEKRCFQVYEDVSEGTPVSPIFGTSEELANWLQEQGNSVDVVTKFLDWGHYPSLVIKNGTNDQLVD